MLLRFKKQPSAGGKPNFAATGVDVLFSGECAESVAHAAPASDCGRIGVGSGRKGSDRINTQSGNPCGNNHRQSCRRKPVHFAAACKTVLFPKAFLERVLATAHLLPSELEYESGCGRNRKGPLRLQQELSIHHKRTGEKAIIVICHIQYFAV